jgi:hypothetical protein
MKFQVSPATPAAGDHSRVKLGNDKGGNRSSLSKLKFQVSASELRTGGRTRPACPGRGPVPRAFRRPGRRPPAPFAETPTKPFECRIASEVVVYAVVLDGKAGATHVRSLKVGKDPGILLQPLGVRCRNLTGCGAGLPDPEEPDQVEPRCLPLVDLPVRHVIKRGRPARTGSQLGQEYPGIDLKQ